MFASSSRYGAIAIVVCTLALMPLNAQTAQLYGSVKDASEGVVTSAELTLTNEATQVSRTTKSNKDGQYAFPFLQPGRYSALVQASGFQSQSKAGIELQVDQQARWDIQMQVGAVQQTVNVASGPSLINSTDGSVSTVIDRTFVENLPLNGRSFQSLFELTPGAVVAKSTANNTGQFNINGQRSTSNYLMIDGVSANAAIGSGLNAAQAPSGVLAATSVLGGTNNLVSVDALQEFRIQTSSFAPEYGRTPGGQVQIVTRSGTNQFHGDVFEYFRNDKLDATNWFSNQNRTAKARERQNDFGGVLGGPVWKDRTFFFVSYEGLRLIQPNTVSGLNVPTAAARAAAPSSTRPFLDAFALPNAQDLGNGLGVLNTSYSTPSNLDAGSIRLDHHLTDRWMLFGRYNEAPSVTTTHGTTPSQIQNSSNRTRTVTAAVTGVLSPTTTLDFHVNWSDITGSTNSALIDYGGATPPPASLLYPLNGNPALSAFTLIAATASYITGQVANNEQKQFQITTALANVQGKHSLKYGLDLRWLSPEIAAADVAIAAQFTSIGLGAASPPAGSFLSGVAPAATVTSYSPAFPLHLKNYSFFAQDTWQVNSRLTLTYGLRWDINPPISAGSRGKLLAMTGVQSPSTLGLAPSGTPLWNTSYTNFAPRLGLAYAISRSPGRETVIRAGAGVFRDLIAGGYIAQQSISAPNSNLQVLTNVAFPLSNVVAPPLPPALPYTQFYGIDPNIATPLVYEYNLGVERALGSRVKASATYVGSEGHHLGRYETLSNPNPNFAVAGIIQSNGDSSYNALQLQIQGHLAGGLQLLGNYVWSHAIDDASSDTATGVPFSTYLPPSIDRASSDFDIRHSGTVALSYNIPRPHGPFFVKAILGGWGSDLTFRARSADPVNVYFTRNLGYGSFQYRPDVVAGVPFHLDDVNAAGGTRLNPAAFQVPAALRQGDLNRNAFRGFDLAQADLAVRRQFSVSEGIKLQFRAEFFNLTNHPNFADPSGSMGSASAAGTTVIPTAFGRSTTMLATGLGGLSPIYQIGGPRSIQLALKVVF